MGARFSGRVQAGPGLLPVPDRVLLLTPESQSARAIDRDKGHPPGTLAARVTATLAGFAQMRQACGTQMVQGDGAARHAVFAVLHRQLTDFPVSVVLLPVEQALSGIGSTITSMETVGALMAARSGLQ